jgi:hypothetical protein
MAAHEERLNSRTHRRPLPSSSNGVAAPVADRRVLLTIRQFVITPEQ